jgi:subtilase family serine protease
MSSTPLPVELEPIPAIASNAFLLDFTADNALQPVDLVGKGFDAIPGSNPNRAVAGQAITVTYRIQNNGDFAAGTFNVDFYLTRDPNSSSAQDFIYRNVPITISGLAAKSESQIFTVDLILPEVNAAFWTGDGLYYLGMTLDSTNVIAEGNEANNQRVGLTLDYDELNITNTQQANLKGKSLVLNKTILNAGDKFNLDFDIQNLGGATGKPYEVKFYLSQDRNIGSAQDILLVTDTLDALAANSSTGGRFFINDLTLPTVNDAFWTGDGTYYIGMVIDSSNAIAETNESDNRNVGLAIDFDDVRINNTQQANLKGKSLVLRQNTLNAGDKFNLDFEIQNLGGATGKPYEVKFYLSQDRNIGSDQDILLVTDTLDALAANSSTGGRFFINDLTLPAINNSFWTGDGTYYIGMVIDSGNAIAETNESDNRNVGLAIDFDDVRINNTRQPDLQSVSFNVTADSIRAGNLAKVDFDIRSAGAASANFEVSFYLSKDNRIDAGTDLFLDKGTISGLAANATGSFTRDLLLPGINNNFWTGDGTYYIGMIIDSGNAIAESNENNNRNQGLRIDLDSLTVNATTLSGTRNNDDLLGTASGDRLSGLRGDDDLFGFGGDDLLWGDRGDDNLYGGTGDDWIWGNAGDDFLWGVDLLATNPGVGEIDRLIGGFGADEFYLGSETKTFYSTGGNNDYASIDDFDSREDTIVLNGSAGNYVLRATSGSLPAGTGIYRNNDLIGVVSGVSNLNLSSSSFAYFS